MKWIITLMLLLGSTQFFFSQEVILKRLGGAAKQRIEQQDFNTTRNNKEKGMLHEQKSTIPPPAPVDTTTLNISRLTYDFSHQMEMEVQDSFAAIYRLRVAQNAVWIENVQTDSIRIVDFDRKVILQIDSVHQTVKTVSFEPKEYTISIAHFIPTSLQKTIANVVAKNYTFDSPDGKSHEQLWIAKDQMLDVNWQFYQLPIAEFEPFFLFMNGRTPVLEYVQIIDNTIIKSLKVRVFEPNPGIFNLSKYTLFTQ